MRQLFQDLRSGSLSLLEVPAPQERPGHLLIRSSRSLISAGTERMLTSFAKAGYLEKARLQPEKVRQVLEKVRTDGVLSAYEAVRARLDQPMVLGYSNVGQVLAATGRAAGYAAGDRIVSNGPHAEVVLVPQNLCARVPDGVTDEQASFTVVGAVALQGIRLIAPNLGETVVVAGLGLIGLLAVQILRAAGCRVLGFDPQAGRVEIARRSGADAFCANAESDPVAIVDAKTGGAGADAVLITASTDDDALISQCAAICRKRGRIVLTGVIGLNLKRSDFYEKELTFQVSCSYGPGRYDPGYEDRGIDYPRPFVRWTAQRNFAAVLELMREGKIVIDGLITDRLPFAVAPDAYARLDDPRSVGIVLDYPGPGPAAPSRTVTVTPQRAVAKGKALAVIGAGAFTQARILPALRKARANVKVIVSAQGASAAIAACKYGVTSASTDIEAVMDDRDVGAVIIATRHDSHAALAIRALQAGKSVFVEKPLCLNDAELDAIVVARNSALQANGAVPALIVGFNRRFAPMARCMREAMAGRAGPAFIVYTCNAGALPPGHWAHDPNIGGGRIIGEACHFIDFLQFLTGSRIRSVRARKAGAAGADLEDNVAITIDFDDGSIGQVNYFACGGRSFPKERCEAAFDGKSLVLDNYRRLDGFGIKVRERSLRQDKGHEAQFGALQRLVSGLDPATEYPLSFEEIESATRATFKAVYEMRET